MLVHRTIREPQEKLYLLFKFIKENDLADDLFFESHFFSHDLSDNNKGIFKNIYVRHDALCEALKVNTQVFNSWFKRRGIKSYGYNVTSSLYFSEAAGFRGLHYKNMYLPLNLFCRINYSHLEAQECNRKKIKKIDVPSIKQLYDTIDEWHKE